MFFDTWTGLGRTVVVGTLAYAALVLILRVSGKRTLSKMNAFDLIVTVALSSTLATVLLARDVPSPRACSPSRPSTEAPMGSTRPTARTM